MQPYKHLKPEEIGQHMKDEWARIRRVASRIPDKIERFEYIVDECPDTQWGGMMCDSLLKWARDNGGIEARKLDWTPLDRMKSKIGRS